MTEYTGLCHGGPLAGQVYTGSMKRDLLMTATPYQPGTDISTVPPSRVIGTYIYENGCFVWEPWEVDSFNAGPI